MELAINMSGFPLPGVPRSIVRIWSVEDPMGKKEKVFNRVRDEIEGLVKNLILELRRARAARRRGPATLAHQTRHQPPLPLTPQTDTG